MQSIQICATCHRGDAIFAKDLFLRTLSMPQRAFASKSFTEDALPLQIYSPRSHYARKCAKNCRVSSCSLIKCTSITKWFHSLYSIIVLNIQKISSVFELSFICLPATASTYLQFNSLHFYNYNHCHYIRYSQSRVQQVSSLIEMSEACLVRWKFFAA